MALEMGIPPVGFRDVALGEAGTDGTPCGECRISPSTGHQIAGNRPQGLAFIPTCNLAPDMPFGAAWGRMARVDKHLRCLLYTS
ncbi:MAG: hypothetical protein ACK56I_07025, partial [bacterium]